MKEEGKNSNAQVHNIRAAKSIVDTVKSTLGPMGMDKMMVDGGGNVIVTNDGATILRELDIAHPGGKMMVEVAKTQESLCYDGTTSTVVLAGQLLANSEALFEKGLHPNVICRGYHEAAQMAVKHLDKISHTAKKSNLGNILANVAKTAITGKTLENALENVSALCVDAVQRAGDVDKVRVVSFPGGSLEDSYLFTGAIVNKDFVLEHDLQSTEEVLLINTGLEPEKIEENLQLQINSVESMQTYKMSGKNALIKSANKIIKALPDGGIVFVRDSVHDTVCAQLKKHRIGVIRRLPPSTMRTLSKIANTDILQTPDDVVYEGMPLKIERKKYNDVSYLFVTSHKHEHDEGTLVLRGATSHTLEEVERGFDDALGVVSLVVNDESYVYGGGVPYVAMSAYLRQHAAAIGGRAQMAIEAFADALEVIPATIAENAGHDPLDTVLAMRHELLQGNDSMGPDVTNGGVTDMKKAGVFEPTTLVRQAVLSASEVTTALLRIDDIIGRRPVE